MIKRFFVRLNRDQPQILLHPCENIPFETREAAERYVEDLKQKGEFYISHYTIHEVDIAPVTHELRRF